MLKYVADQIGADPAAFTTYARRKETRRDHIARLMIYFDVRSLLGRFASDGVGFAPSRPRPRDIGPVDPFDGVDAPS